MRLSVVSVGTPEVARLGERLIANHPLRRASGSYVRGQQRNCRGSEWGAWHDRGHHGRHNELWFEQTSDRVYDRMEAQAWFIRIATVSVVATKNARTLLKRLALPAGVEPALPN
jgi:hypothetical protein